MAPLPSPLGRLVAAKEGLGAGHWGDELGGNAANGVNLYRANVGSRLRGPQHLHTDVPVLVVRPTRDEFLTDVLLDDLDRCGSDVRAERLDAGHWVARTHPEVVARLVLDQVDRAAT